MVCHRQKAAARSPQTGAWVFVCHSVCQLVFPELMLDTPYLLCIPTCSAGAVPLTPKLPISILATCTSSPRTAQKQYDHLFPLKKSQKTGTSHFRSNPCKHMALAGEHRCLHNCSLFSLANLSHFPSLLCFPRKSPFRSTRSLQSLCAAQVLWEHPT